MRALGRFLTRHRIGRAITMRVHPLVHDGLRHPLTFAVAAGCWVCRIAWSAVDLPPEAFTDRSQIKISEPTGERLGLTMTATAKRQYDKIMEGDPETAEALRKAMDAILRDLKTGKMPDDTINWRGE